MSQKAAPEKTEAYRLMGTYCWLAREQKRAVKWWARSLKEGERLGARLELSRTYFEIGRRFVEKESKYKEFNGIRAEEYLDMARSMFEKMSLKWDLERLEKTNHSG